MRAEEFDQATEEELLSRANKCFDLAKSPLDEPILYSADGQIPISLDDEGKLRLLLEAQFYLTAVARKKDAKVSDRDFRLEIWVIVLIGVEILLSIVGIAVEIREGNQQARVLSNIETSTKDSAGAMSAAKTSLEILAASQTKSLSHLQQMDHSLQSSQETTGAMASAARKQLQILQDEQTSRISQLAKKPKLALYVGVVPLNATLKVNLTPREQTDTSISFDMRVANEGDAVATRPLLRVIVSRNDVSLTGNDVPPIQKVPQPIDHQLEVYLLHLDNIRPSVNMFMSLTFSFPKGTKPFQVGFNIDSDEITPPMAFSC
jgi:hypothetical protein